MKDLFEFSELLDQYAGLLTDHQREIACQYVYEDFSLFEISERTGISRQGVRDCLNKAEKTLRHYETVLGLVKKNKTVSAAADRIAPTIPAISYPPTSARILISLSDVSFSGSASGFRAGSSSPRPPWRRRSRSPTLPRARTSNGRTSVARSLWTRWLRRWRCSRSRRSSCAAAPPRAADQPRTLAMRPTASSTFARELKAEMRM